VSDARTIPTARAKTARERLAGLMASAPIAAPIEVPVEVPIEILPEGNLRTPRFHLRPLTETDRPEFIRVIERSRAHLERFSELHLPEETDDALFDRQLALTQRGESSGLALRRIAVTGRGQIAGAFNFNSISRGLTWGGDLNWWVAAESLNKGVATECIGGIVTHALRDVPGGLGLHEVRAYIQRENTYSIRIATKLGFTKQGDERTHLQTGDKWQLHDLYVRRVQVG